MTSIVPYINENEARVNITYGGQNGDLIDPVLFDSSDDDILAMVTEAVRTGGVPGIPSDDDADFEGFVVERNVPNEGRSHNLLIIRPKTPFGTSCK